jgi:hypothetical protein
MCGKRMVTPQKLENAQLPSKESLFSARGVLLPLLTVVRPLVYQSNSFHYCHSAGEACLSGLVHRRKAFPACGCIYFSPFKQQCAPVAGAGLQGLAVFTSLFPF